MRATAGIDGVVLVQTKNRQPAICGSECRRVRYRHRTNSGIQPYEHAAARHTTAGIIEHDNIDLAVAIEIRRRIWRPVRTERDIRGHREQGIGRCYHTSARAPQTERQYSRTSRRLHQRRPPAAINIRVVRQSG